MLNAARKILAARMATWTTTPIHWPNTAPLTTSNAPWVRFAVIGNGDALAVLSPNPPSYESGFVAVQVFASAGTGDGTASTLSDAIADLFRGYESGGVQCGNAKKQTIGPADGWYQINITVPWTITG